MQSPPAKPSALVKPTLDTRFHIDYSWWERSGEDLRIYLLSHLAPERRERLLLQGESRTLDFIDPETGEISRLDELQMAIRSAAQDPAFISPHTSVVDGIFRVFLANDNRPLSSGEIAEYVGRPASVILKTLSGGRIYKGIRPTET